MSRFFNWYSRTYKRLPYPMAFITCFGKGSLSDGITQTKLEKNTKQIHKDQWLDYKRNVRFAVWSGTYCGCIQHFVYNVLYARLFPSTTVLSRLICTLFDCFVHGPVSYFPSYYISKSLMTGGTAMEGFDEYRNNIWKILTPYWKVWCPSIFLIMFFLPPQFRVLAIAGVSLFWLILLSYMSPMVEENLIQNDDKLMTQNYI